MQHKQPNSGPTSEARRRTPSGSSPVVLSRAMCSSQHALSPMKLCVMDKLPQMRCLHPNLLIEQERLATTSCNVYLSDQIRSSTFPSPSPIISDQIRSDHLSLPLRFACMLLGSEAWTLRGTNSSLNFWRNHDKSVGGGECAPEIACCAGLASPELQAAGDEAWHDDDGVLRLPALLGQLTARPRGLL